MEEEHEEQQNPEEEEEVVPVREIKTKKGFEKVINSNEGKLVVVDFTAENCGACQNIKQFYEDLAVANPDAVFIKVDVHTNKKASEDIEYMPTFRFYRDGEVLFQFTGSNSALLQEKVTEYMAA